jgi:ribonuclease HI
MPDFKCTVCGEVFALSQELLDRYPGWKPRYCRRHKGGGSKSSGSSTQKAPSKSRSRPRGSSMSREENLPLSEVLQRYSSGPQTGVFTDGSCSPNPGAGGWGVAWLKDGQLHEQRYGKEDDTTNNRMEMLALIEAMKMLPGDAKITVYSDSQLCVNTLNTWAVAWQRRGWKRKGGPIKNLDLVQAGFELKQQRPGVTIEWIAAHSGHLGNELADSLATAWMRAVL